MITGAFIIIFAIVLALREDIIGCRIIILRHHIDHTVRTAATRFIPEQEVFTWKYVLNKL